MFCRRTISIVFMFHGASFIYVGHFALNIHVVVGKVYSYLL